MFLGVETRDTVTAAPRAGLAPKGCRWDSERLGDNPCIPVTCKTRVPSTQRPPPSLGVCAPEASARIHRHGSQNRVLCWQKSQKH